MTKEQILKAVIEKAVQNGYQTDWYKDGKFFYDEIYGQIWDFNDGVWEMVFSHSFAKALWGDEKGYIDDYFPDSSWISAPDSNCDTEVWQYHLAKLALSENRIEYLKQFI